MGIIKNFDKKEKATRESLKFPNSKIKK